MTENVFPISDVHRIPLPLSFELNHVNVYLIRLESGYLLMDCGLNDDACFEALRSGLTELGVSWSDIRQILLTHMHPDHIGLARRVLDLTGARLLMHKAEVEHLAAIASLGRRPRWLDDVLHDAGVPAAMIAAMEAGFGEIMKSLHKLDPDRVLADGDGISAAIGALEVVWTPGHSPGHICLYCPSRKLLFSGDHILENITPNIGWLPGRDALGDYLASLERVGQLEVEWILPSHGAPFSGHRAWIRATTKHHEVRCAQILRAIDESSKTAHELVSDLWPEQLTPFHHRFAVFEVLAHLHYLQNRGQLIAARDNGALRWGVNK